MVKLTARTCITLMFPSFSSRFPTPVKSLGKWSIESKTLGPWSSQSTLSAKGHGEICRMIGIHTQQECLQDLETMSSLVQTTEQRNYSSNSRGHLGNTKASRKIREKSPPKGSFQTNIKQIVWTKFSCLAWRRVLHQSWYKAQDRATLKASHLLYEP